MTDFVKTAAGATIAYDREGDGPPVVLIGGAFQHRAFDPDTRELTTELARRGLTAVHYDRPGRGETTAQPPYGLDAQLDALDALLGTTGPATLYGSSSGAAIALAAATAGLPVTRLILWEAPLDDELGPDGALFLATLREKIVTGDGDEIVSFFMKDMPAEWLEQSRQGPGWPVMTSVGPSLEGDAEALAWTQSAPRAELWKTVTQPTLVLLGEQTLPFFPPAADSIVASLADARQDRVQGAGHRWSLDDLASKITSFLGR